MRKSLPKLRESLEKQGFLVTDIRYTFHGRCWHIGFSATNTKTNAYVEVQPMGFNEWFICFQNPWKFALHYAKKRTYPDGASYIPALCRPYKFMKKEILEHLQNEKSESR